MKRAIIALSVACLGVAIVAADTTEAYARYYRGAVGSRTVNAYRGPNGGVAVHSRTAYARGGGYSGGGYYRGGGYWANGRWVAPGAAAAAGLAVGTAAGVAATNRYNYNYNCYYYHAC